MSASGPFCRTAHAGDFQTATERKTALRGVAALAYEILLVEIRKVTSLVPLLINRILHLIQLHLRREARRRRSGQRRCFVYCQDAPIHAPSVQHTDGCLKIHVICQRDESKTSRPAGNAVVDNLRRFGAKSAGLHPLLELQIR